MSPIVFASVRIAAASLVLLAVTTAQAAGPKRIIDNYVLFAYDEMILKGASETTDRGYVRGGDIGVNYPTGAPGVFALTYATYGRVIMDPGSQAVADSVRADNPLGVFFDLYANRLNPSFAATILGVGPVAFTPPIIATADLPVLPFTPGRALTDGANDVTVGGIGLPSPYTFAPGPYRDVRVNGSAVVSFGDGVFDLRSLSLGPDVSVIVTDKTVLQIDRGWTVNNGLRFGIGTKSGAKILLGAFGLNASVTPVTNLAHNDEIHAQFFSPNGWLDLGGRNQLFGRYWAKRISGDPNNDVTLEFPPEHPPGEDPERFQCYETHRKPMMLKGVSLVDALGPSTVTVERAKRICAPADVNGTDPTAPLEPGHFTYYTLKQTSPPIKPVKGVTVTNAFGTVKLTLAKPDRMLVPTAKSLVGTPGPLVSPPDHYKCYRVAGAKTRASKLIVTDQFGTMVVDIKNPLHVCLAAEKNGEPVMNPAKTLMCYRVQGTPPKTAPALVYTANQFGPDRFPFFGPRDLCVTSTVVLP